MNSSGASRSAYEVTAANDVPRQTVLTALSSRVNLRDVLDDPVPELRPAPQEEDHLILWGETRDT
jgi:hypothetical protein